MKYIYAALLIHKAGNEINAERMETVLKSVGVEPEDYRLNPLLAALEGVDIEEALKKGIVPMTTAPLEEIVEDTPIKEEDEEEEEDDEPAGLAALFT